MMMKNNKNENLLEIKKTLEEIRRNQFSDIPKGIIEEIVDIQFLNQESDSRINGRTVTQKTIRKFIDTKTAEDSQNDKI